MSGHSANDSAGTNAPRAEGDSANSDEPVTENGDGLEDRDREVEASDAEYPETSTTEFETEPGTAPGPDTATEPAGPTCPQCGTRLVATTTAGPATHYGSPCGCRLRSTELE